MPANSCCRRALRGKEWILTSLSFAVKIIRTISFRRDPTTFDALVPKNLAMLGDPYNDTIPATHGAEILMILEHNTSCVSSAHSERYKVEGWTRTPSYVHARDQVVYSWMATQKTQKCATGGPSSLITDTRHRGFSPFALKHGKLLYDLAGLPSMMKIAPSAVTVTPPFPEILLACVTFQTVSFDPLRRVSSGE